MLKLRKGLDNQRSQYWMMDIADKDYGLCHVISYDSYIDDCIFFKVFTDNSLTGICINFII